MRVDYNIEFAHIYVNEDFNREHFEAAIRTKQATKNIVQLGKSYVLTVLIDDYNPSDEILDTQVFLQKLESLKVKPDYVIYESKLVYFQDLLLDRMNGKIKKKYENYINKQRKCPCSFLVAVWHLLRLGVFSEEKIISNKQDKPFSAKRTITILPRRYESVERKAISIINSTAFCEHIKNIEHIFF